MDERLDGIQATLTAGGRLDDTQILALVSTTDLISLGMLADDARRRRHGDRTTFARVAVVPVDAIARLEVPGAAGELRVVGAPDSLEVAETVVTSSRGCRRRRVGREPSRECRECLFARRPREAVRA